MSENSSKDSLSRRRFLKLGTGVTAVGGTALGGWGLTEIIVDKGPTRSWHKSVCRYCGTGCGIMVGMHGKKVTRIRGDLEAHNKGVICIKGSMLAELTQLQNRATKPKIRKNGKLEEASWNEVMSLITEKFKSAIAQHGADSVAYYGSGQLLIEESYTAKKADIHLPVVPGTDMLLLNAMAYEIVRNEWYDPEFLVEHIKFSQGK